MGGRYTIAAAIGLVLALIGGVVAAVSWAGSGQSALGSAAFGWAMTCGIIALFLLALLVLRPWDKGLAALWWLSSIFVVVCLIGLTISWILVFRSPTKELVAGREMSNDSQVARYLEEHLPAGKTPVRIPTGLFVQSVEFSSSENVKVSGYIWQRFGPDAKDFIPKDKDDQPGVVLPEAEQSYEAKEVYRREVDGKTVIGYYFAAELRQKFDYRAYPLDRQNVWIRMWQPDFDKDAVLVPDYTAYPEWVDKAFLGVDKQIVTGAWRQMYTTFSYAQYRYASSFGMTPKYAAPVSYPDMYFNMVFKRDFKGPLIGNLIPILLIASIIFLSLFVTSRDERGLELFGSNTFAVIAFTVTMLLVLVVDHNAIREIATDGSVLYFEYVYFALYALVLMTTLNGILIAMDRTPAILLSNRNALPKLIYWPLAVSILLVGTLSVFFL